MTVESVAAEHYTDRQILTAAATRAALVRWRRISTEDLDASWQANARDLLAVLTQAQIAAAATADAYTRQVLQEQAIDPDGPSVRPEKLAGVASDGRPLVTLAYAPIIEAKGRIGRGEDSSESLRKATNAFARIAETQIADAGRVADGVAAAARPQVTGYYRKLTTPSCARCAVLAGRWYRWSSGFQRHPRCDCIHVPGQRPSAEDVATDPRRYFDSLDDAAQDRLFTKSGAQAIRDGADIGQVVNARRGMSTAAGPASRRRMTRDESGLFTTREGARRRQRLMPESIYELAVDRDDAIRLLRSNGFIT